INELENRYTSKIVEDLFVKARPLGDYNIIIGHVGDFGLAIRAAAVATQKETSAIVIISSETKAICAVGKDAKLSAREVLNTLIPNAKISGDSGRAVADQKLSISEEEALTKLEKVLE
ncbi:TPA: hypothetical protein H1005_00915, partial [archaeon]|nr:hypothetical protein [Candidatus Naiadarchaeales archaeon SRR2090153.bin1042]